MCLRNRGRARMSDLCEGKMVYDKVTGNRWPEHVKPVDPSKDFDFYSESYSAWKAICILFADDTSSSHLFYPCGIIWSQRPN